ncbi:threonine synthase [uncultured Cytophaga sp.]|mgnify:FL=1|uniref:threonine synthase n=1 Tax=uncultured Cytophaga sp. TaxID=160238 RepID=UPI00262DF0A4|nr:threonine synthase [uncultured Cytophaga sp.]
MKLYSTNHQVPEVNLKEAVFKGLPDDNGLYMPDHIPTLPQSFFDTIETLSFQDIAFEVCKALIGDEVPEKEIRSIVDDVLTFEAPVIKVEDNVYVLELFHGPTLAFKDFGARFMARLMSYFLQKEKTEIMILVATSGDTGSAVAQGFLGREGIKVTILYPSKKVSDLQEKQLTTLGQNITALEVLGTFDDCQRMVKQAFLDKDITSKINLSSANSINISRLIPQSFYYFYAYAQAKKLGRKVVFSVPSGNFGNICGGLIAKKMGLPIEMFIASTNLNDIMPTYIKTGIFTAKPSVATISNAMDVGNPSNYPRVIELYNKDIEALRKNVIGKVYTDKETAAAMKAVYQSTGYVMDPHGAVGYLGLKEYFKETGIDATGIFLATAHPAKFIEVVNDIIEKDVEIPARLQEVANKKKESIVIDNDFEKLKAFLLK